MKRISSNKLAGSLILAVFLAVFLVVVAYGLSGLAQPARAEESLGEHSFYTEVGTEKYTMYLYPNLNQAFYVPDSYETRFDIHNAKFWKIEYREVLGPVRALLKTGIRQEPEHAISLEMDVAFYTPRGERFHTESRVRPNWWLSIPHGRNSLEYDRLQVRIRNHSGANRDFRFVTLDPVDPVRGTPIPTRRDVHI